MRVSEGAEMRYHVEYVGYIDYDLARWLGRLVAYTVSKLLWYTVIMGIIALLKDSEYKER